MGLLESISMNPLTFQGILTKILVELPQESWKPHKHDENSIHMWITNTIQSVSYSVPHVVQNVATSVLEVWQKEI